MPTNFPAYIQDQITCSHDGGWSVSPSRDEQVHDLRRRVYVYVYVRDSRA